MKNLITLIINTSIIALVCSAGIKYTNAQIMFQKTFGEENYYDECIAVEQTIDDGYILAGMTRYIDEGYRDIYLIKTDINGDMIWRKTYGGTNNDVAKSMQKTADGGYIITGWTISFGEGYEDVYLIKTDDNGNLLWSKTFGGASREKGYSVQQTVDGGYIITGYTESFGAVNEDVYLIKTDGNGDLMWSKTFGGTGQDIGHSVKQTVDGGYIIAGIRNNDVYIIKTDNQGDILWTRILGDGNSSSAFSIQQTIDYGYIIVGSTNSFGVGERDVYLIRMNENGDILWAKTFGDIGVLSETGYSVQQTDDGGYIIAGERQKTDPGPYNVYLIKTNADGDLQWSKIFGTTIESGQSVKQTDDGGYVIAGNKLGSIINYYGNYDVYLIKTNSFGTTGINCFPPYEADVTTIVTTPIPDIETYETITGSGANVNVPATIENTTTTVQNNLCEFICDYAITISFSTTDVQCNGYNNGTATASVSGGNSPYNYYWSDGQNTQTINNLSPGTYYLTVVDDNGCETYDNITITEPTQLEISVSSVYAFCNENGEATATASGGTPPYSYHWSDGQNTQTATNLSTGLYYVGVTDANGCTIGSNVYVSETPPTAYVYTADVSATWQPGDNPFGGISEVHIGYALIIPEGISITIKDMVFKFNPGAYVRLYNSTTSGINGAKLTLDHTIFTSYNDCYPELMWNGVQVLGSNTDQYLTDQQPILYLKVSTIENAKNGVISTYGSIVKGLYATFKNNIIGAFLGPFSGNTGANEMKNKSYFHYCNFITDAALNDPGENPDYFVVMYQINYINIKANTFQNTAVSNFDIVDRGFGIVSVDATYNVYYNNIFNDLYYAILASASNPLYTVTIDNNEFNNNYRAVLLSGVGFATITSNEFKIADYSSSVPSTPYTGNYPYGLYLEGCSGYKVEENIYYNSNPFNNNIGAFIRESGNNYNEFYNNTFGLLIFSIVACDDNDGPGYCDGLEILCNNFVTNQLDIVVVSDVMNGDIGDHQGDCTGNTYGPAGNRFSHTCFFENSEEYYVEKLSEQVIEYSFHPESLNTAYNTQPKCFDNFEIPGGKVDAFNNNCMVKFEPGDGTESSCPSKLNQGLNIIIGNIDYYKEKAEESKVLIDGGDTQYLLDVIAQGNPGLILYYLKKYSPYISNEVLIAAINSGLPAGILMQIIIKNSPVSNEVMDALNNITVPLPNGVINKINTAQTGETSAMEELKLDIAYNLSRREKSVNDLIRYYLNDTLEGSLKKAMIIIKEEAREGKETSRRQLVSAYIMLTEYDKAEFLIDSLYPAGNYDSYYKLMYLIIELRKAGETVEKLKTDTIKEQIVREIAADTTHKIHFYAQNILKLVFEESFPEKIVLPDLNNNKMVFFIDEEENNISEKTNLLDENHKLRCFPNPFSDYTTIEAYVPEDFNNAEIIIYNLLGIVIKRYELEQGYNAITILKDDIASEGIYFYALKCNGQLLEKKKMIIIK